MNNKDAAVIVSCMLTFAVAYHFLYQYLYPKFKKKTVPESCPGTSSSAAGKAQQCQGCPNQSKCASGETSRLAAELRGSVERNLQSVRQVILVMSGKGGVGKSTVATQLAHCLQRLGSQVGLLDIDITGPSIPGMTATQDQQVFESGHGWTPIYLQDGLAVLSIGHLLNDPKSSIVWRGPKKDSLIRQFLTGVCWDGIEVLIIDCPPGSSDEHISICNLLECKQPMAVMVTTPQMRSLDDVHRCCHFCELAKVKILALVENMTNSVFDKCTHQQEEKVDHCRELCHRYNIASVVKFPLDAKVVQASEQGVPLDECQAMQELAQIVLKANLNSVS